MTTSTRPSASRLAGHRLALAAGLPLLTGGAAAYLLLLVRYPLRGLVLDQWQVVELAHRVSRGVLTLGALWAPHNENRMLVSNLVMLGLNLLDRMNPEADVLVAAALLLAAVVLLARVTLATVPRPVLALVPAALVVLSWNQFATALSPFAVALYLVLLLLLVMLSLLLASERRPWLFWPALVLAAAASVSSAQGLGLWPAGLVWLVARGRPPARSWQWLAGAAVTVFLYSFRFPAGHSQADIGAVVANPGQAAAFFGLLVGAAIPEARRLGIGAQALAGAGAVIVATVALAFVTWLRRPPLGRSLALPLALAAFGLSVDLMVVAGRGQHGWLYAQSPRYIWTNLWLLGAAWMAAVVLWSRPGRARRLRLVPLAALAVLVLLQVGLGYRAGAVGASTASLRSAEAGRLTLQYRKAPASAVRREVGIPVGQFRTQAAYLERARLNVFSQRR